MNTVDYKWTWFIGTIIGSLIPVILRLLVSLDCKILLFDIKDILFAALAISLSNLNLGQKKSEEQKRLALFSALSIVFVSVFLGMFLYDEALEFKNDLYWLKCFSFVLVATSIWISYKVNKYSYTNKTIENE